MVDEYLVNHYSYMWTSQQDKYILQEIEDERYVIVRLPNDIVTIEDNEVYHIVKVKMMNAGNKIVRLSV